MQANRAFTLIETLVVGAILLIGMTGWLVYYLNVSQTNTNQAADQEYYNQLARLEFRVKSDLRNCQELTEEAPGAYRLQIFHLTPDQRLLRREVTYRLNAERVKVERMEEGTSDVFDFSRFLENRPFVFKLSP